MVDEESVLFTVDDDGGIVEPAVPTIISTFFSDDLDLFDDKEIRDSVGFSGRSMGALFCFTWGSTQSCRFHEGPTTGTTISASMRPRMYRLDCISKMSGSPLLFDYWLGGNTSRLQDLKGVNVGKVFLDLRQMFLSITQHRWRPSLRFWSMRMDTSEVRMASVLYFVTEISPGSRGSSVCFQHDLKISNEPSSALSGAGPARVRSARCTTSVWSDGNSSHSCSYRCTARARNSLRSSARTLRVTASIGRNTTARCDRWDSSSG